MVDKATMATLPTIDINVFTVIVGSYRLMRERVPYDACFRVVRYVSTCLLIRAGDDGCSFGRCGHFHQPMSLPYSASRSSAFAEVCSTLVEVPSTLAEIPSMLAEMVSSLAVVRCYSEHMVTSMRWFCFRSACAICCTSWAVMLSTIWQ